MWQMSVMWSFLPWKKKIKKDTNFFIINKKYSSYMLLVYDLQRKRACFGTQSQQKPHGWVEDNRGHLSSVCFLWCAATKLCCQNTQGCPRALLCAQGQAHWSTFTAHWLHWEMPVCWQSAGTIAAVFESEGFFFFAGWLHNHAIINLNWSSLATHRKNFEHTEAAAWFPLGCTKSKLISGSVNWIANYLYSCWRHDK